ncbi:DUF4344 domain-containing metallopeptidase [Aliiroseovarius subalbicans]|uniref:DUF4344 domain-containing metallopeptidase n=1 Tax=Aliiroseovarius subalbicans TaxID=2925840 RepID=UPI001F5880B5|nr:DUF4344 domain-containing metallopeptidase [Aliiroseovarius subalbicans]MCI2400655.1 DUF4344 domain-containing metallopeptidase [Aliiroseovarius subalbicans]
MLRLSVILVLSAALSFPVHAQQKGDDSILKQSGGAVSTALPSAADAVDPVERFVESNIIETMYHELAHGLIEMMDLPVFGPEEFAADLFSIVLMNRVFDEETAIRLAYDVAAAYDHDAKRIDPENIALWDVHGPDRQRYYNLACLFYGADPDGREFLAEELGLPDDRAETCGEEYAQAARSWGAVLDQLGEAAPGDSLSMDWVLDENAHLTRFVRAEVDRLNQLLTLPSPLLVSVIPCGEINAFYDPGKAEIIICTEFGEHLAEMAR